METSSRTNMPANKAQNWQPKAGLHFSYSPLFACGQVKFFQKFCRRDLEFSRDMTSDPDQTKRNTFD
jgi:hypothetical protein